MPDHDRFADQRARFNEIKIHVQESHLTGVTGLEKAGHFVKTARKFRSSGLPGMAVGVGVATAKLIREESHAAAVESKAAEASILQK